MKQIHVAAGVVKNAQGAILLARRPVDKHQGGLWEFPGGKVEPGESAQAALARELAEEVGIDITASRPLIQVAHRYPDKSVLLDVFLVTGFSGEARGCEGQAICWTEPENLHQFEFPAANTPIVAACQLPNRLLITGDVASPQRCLRQVESAFSRGVGAVMLRTAHPDRIEIAAELQLLCRQQHKLFILNGSVAEAEMLGVTALHLNSQRLGEISGRDAFAGQWLSASCHSPEELRLAAEKGMDFALLSPVMQTASHPEVAPVGWQQFSDWTQSCAMPVFALGGLHEADLDVAYHHGAQGIAAISAWWD
ncbi:Nudix family hydrolase [Pontibacter sp. JAM-7]|uniref:Nudix family hydrolase n=1 Tax=Pontibacter sp. JAM-7 TaxID=3366581 RepID=UPI003AF570ED